MEGPSRKQWKDVVAALHRTADLDARRISVKVNADVVELTGSVGSWVEREAAEQAASSAPGIARVENHILVGPIKTADEPDEIC
jgi:osmotically-inducible protein OsmY